MANYTSLQVMTFPADVSQLEKALAFIRTIAEKAACPHGVEQSIELAFEEIFVNIAHYAYPATEPGDVRIGCKTEQVSDRSRVIIIFADRGKSYNPLEHADPDITVPIEERNIGGLGILMVKRIMDTVQYDYTKGWNRLVIMKSWQNARTENPCGPLP
ncbi:MAG: ATP-binding protein [Treponema sp.]|jgi:anti-sigma regulatory factor (Ser/Thr protein kinase)|nr:ATP-binding protein [Treponema sp.]